MTFGLIVTYWRIGHGFSYLLAETIWHLFGAAVTFLSLGGISIISLIILVFGVTIPTYELEAPTRRSIVRTTSLVNLIDAGSNSDDNEPVRKLKKTRTGQLRKTSGAVNKPVYEAKTIRSTAYTNITVYLSLITYGRYTEANDKIDFIHRVSRF